MLLGHTGREGVLDSTFEHVRPRAFRKALRRPSGGPALREVRDPLLTMGSALGVRPPIPVPGRTIGWSPARGATVLDATLGLLAGLLYRWRSPLTGTRPGPGTRPELHLPEQP